MESWAAKELAGVQLGDLRYKRRLIRLVEAMAAQPGASVPQACGDWAATKGAYRFWDSSRVDPEEIRAAHQQSTTQRLLEHRTVLAVQDTTELNFTRRRSVRGLGYLDHPVHRGLKVHSALVVSAQGVPLGVIYQEVWARDPAGRGKRLRRRLRETKAKESQRWLNALAASQEAIPANITQVTVTDCEGDIYDLFAAPRGPETHLLIRGVQNRRVRHEARYLWPAIRQSPVRGSWTVEVRRQEDRDPRQAIVTLRYATLAIEPPQNRRGRAALRPIPLQVILVEEEHPPAGAKPIRWLLLTTLPVTTFDEAVRCVEWYTYRWLIERYHYTLKSGCRVEELQLETAERIGRALATCCVVAWRLLWLTYEARQHPDIPCDRVLEAHEWQALYCTIHKTAAVPATPPTLHEAVTWIAQLGGFLGRRHDGQPGVKVIWRGLRRLSDIAATWHLLHSTSTPNSVDT